VVKISEAIDSFVDKTFPTLESDLRLAQMRDTPSQFVIKAFLLSSVFSLNGTAIAFFILLKLGRAIVTIPLFFIMFIIFFLICIEIPRLNINKVRADIEGDIFIPSRMLLTLLETGNSIISALVGVSYTKAKSSTYFGKIASRVFMGTNIEDAIDEAIENTPSDSFKRVLEPIKKTLKTGADVSKSLLATLEDLSKEKIIEIEKYEKKLAPIAMFYMIFGSIMPAVLVVVIVILFSVIGLKVEFFPFLFILILLLIMIQLIFVRVFQATRPLVKI